MSRIIVEYNPALSIKAQKLIRADVTPSMVSNDETSAQYEIDMVAELLEQYDEPTDLKLVNELIKEGVHYIEF